MLEHDKKVIKTYIIIVWGIVIFVPLFLVIASIVQFVSFKNDFKNGQEAYFNTLNQVYSSEIISIQELDSIKNQMLSDTTYVFDDRMQKRFQNIEKSIIRHKLLIDSLNNDNLLLFEGKIDSLNNSIDLYNKKVNKMKELKIDFELKSNVFYSLVLLIIALTAFLGYRSFVNIKTSVKDDTTEEARKTAKFLLSDELKRTIMDLIREDGVINDNWANFESELDRKLEEFKNNITSDIDTSDSAKISVLENKVDAILQKLEE
ncbi:hypothetical protein [Flagellimonas zhangzhouensis]|uniref:Uncharacterized protein n=1 Tax=Flagellimonas zhangzhouensis TaxID=1073328 RepID=A0A1H2SIN0_9FLAO|nr:hypothetical protein [Allomuricauda zhangzhouensis]SDQ75418.1 hypothetical protein SAMN05216294_2476 [Allomuricauda zhangzhouensis]SDW31553.1 hypothetical protein SAMN04487892_1119 [Allomuricauda zhangzhouensis]